MQKFKRFICILLGIMLILSLPLNLFARERRSYNFMSKTPANAAIRSLILPGWGQFFNEQPAKGLIFAGVELATVATAFLMYNNASSTYDDYKTQKKDTLYDDYTQQINTTNIVVGVSAAIWIFNVVDAALSASSSREESSSLPKVYLEVKNKDEINLKYNLAF